MSLGMLILAAVVSALLALRGNRVIVALKNEQVALQQEALAPRPQVPELAPLMPYDASARAAWAQAQAGWGPLLTSLESMQVVGVTPTSIDVSSADRKVRVELAFSDWAALLRFVDEINAGEPAARWRLQQAQVGDRAPAPVGAAPSGATMEGTW